MLYKTDTVTVKLSFQESSIEFTMGDLGMAMRRTP